MEESTLRCLLSDLITYLPAKLLPALTGFITAPILTRLFAPAVYADYALAVGLSGLLYALAISGLASTPIRFLPVYAKQRRLPVFFVTLGTLIGLMVLGTSIVTLIVLRLLQPRLPGQLYPLLQISVLLFGVQALVNVLLDGARAQERSRLYTTFDLLTRYGALGLGLLLVMGFGMGIDGLLWGALLVFALALPPMLRRVIQGASLSLSAFQRGDAGQLWRYSWPLALGNMAMWGLILSDRYIISYFRPETEVGLYAVAYNLASKSIELIVALFMLSLGPIVMHTWEKSGAAATEEALVTITRLFLILGVPAATGLTLLARPFVGLLTAPAYHEGYRVVGFVTFASLTWGLSQIAGMGTLIQEKTGYIARNQLLAATANIVLNLLLVPSFGYIAAGVTTLLGYLLLLALQSHTAQPYLPWRFPYATLGHVVIATAVMGGTIWGGSALLLGPQAGNGLTIGVTLTLALPSYFATLWLLNEAGPRERALLASYFHRPAGGQP